MLKFLQHTLLLLCSVLLLLTVASDLSQHNLGDSVTSKQSESDLFSDIDINGNGRISEAELFEVITASCI